MGKSKDRSGFPRKAERLALTYCFGGTCTYEPGEVLGPRLLTDYEAVLIIEGFPLYRTEEGDFPLEPGSLLVARPGSRETYQWDQKSRTRHAYLHFQLDAIPADWPELESWPTTLEKPNPVLGRLFQMMLERAAQQDQWPAQIPAPPDQRLFETFLDLYLREQDRSENASYKALSEPVRRAVKFMRERLDSSQVVDFNLSELADAAHVTEKHLCRVFQQELGLSPMKACRLMKFQLAIALLARSNLDIKAIAARCGYPDQLHFSRSFSQTFGLPPRAVRENLEAGKAAPPNPLPPVLMPRLYW